MTTTSLLAEKRVLAGERYSAALKELFAAMIDLAALDRCLSASSFAHDLQGLAADLEHPAFAPRIPRRLADEIRTATETYVAGLAA